MKSREQFIDDIYRKSEEVKQNEAQKRKRIRRLSAGGMSLAACLILVFGVAGFTGNFSSQNSPGTEKALCQEQIALRDSECVQMYSEDENDEDTMHSEDIAESGTSKNKKTADSSLNDTTEDSNSGGNSILGYSSKDARDNTETLYEAKTNAGKVSGKADTKKSGTGSSDSKTSDDNHRSQDVDTSHTTSQQIGDQTTADESSGADSDESIAQKMPAHMIQINKDGSRIEIADEDMQGILEKILRLAEKKNTVWRRLGDAEPEADYTKKILFILYDPQSNNALAEDDLQNIVWYFLDK